MLRIWMMDAICAQWAEVECHPTIVSAIAHWNRQDKENGVEPSTYTFGGPIRTGKARIYQGVWDDGRKYDLWVVIAPEQDEEKAILFANKLAGYGDNPFA